MTSDGDTTGGTGDTGTGGPTLERRAEELGREIGRRAEGLGREAEEASRRLARDPAVFGVADLATRVVGAVLLAVGLWYFADVTLGLGLPSIPWGTAWPLAIVLVGLLVMANGVRRRA